MISFSEFVSEKSSDGTYASVTYTSGSKNQLRKIQKDLDIPNPLNKNKFHTTVIFSRKELPEAKSRDLRYKSDVTELVLEEWMQRNDKMCLVAKFDSEWLNTRHEHYRALGGTHDFDSFQPHITLSYDIEDKVGSFNGKVINLDRPLVFSREVVEPLDLNWVK